MPLKLQTSAPVPFLKNYVPYSTNNQTLVEEIENMISCNVIQNEQPVDLQFFFGATQAIVKRFELKNLTNNTDLEIVMEYDSEILEVTPSNIVLLPEQTVVVVLRVRPENIQPSLKSTPFDFKINVRNIRKINEPLVYRSMLVASSEPTLLDQTINIFE